MKSTAAPVPLRVGVTLAAQRVIEQLRRAHGPVMFHLSGGCCDGSAPMCFQVGEFRLGSVDEKVGEIAGLTAERTLRESARICYSDPRRLCHADGSLKQIAEMDDDTRAAIASFEIDERKVDGVVIGRTIKIKLWDKNRALEMAMKHLGLYERGNAQRSENLALQVVLVK